MIHETAIIAKDAKIAKTAEIGAHTIIGEGVTIGENVKILSGCYLEFCTIGEGSKIGPFATIGTEPQDLGYKGEKTGVVVGKNCWIREYSTINRAAGEGNTVVGDNCMIMIGAHIGHNCQLDENVILANMATLGGHCHVGKGAFLGGMSVYHQNVHIGEGTIVSGASGTRKDLPPFVKAEGRPAITIGINAIGLRRKGVDKKTRDLLHTAIRLLKSPEYNTSQALEIVEKMEKNEYIDKLIEFVRNSKRGVSFKASKDQGTFEGRCED